MDKLGVQQRDIVSIDSILSNRRTGRSIVVLFRNSKTAYDAFQRVIKRSHRLCVWDANNTIFPDDLRVSLGMADADHYIQMPFKVVCSTIEETALAPPTAAVTSTCGRS